MNVLTKDKIEILGKLKDLYVAINNFDELLDAQLGESYHNEYMNDIVQKVSEIEEYVLRK